MGLHHLAEPRRRAANHRAEPPLLNLAREVLVLPAHVVAGDVDLRVLLVPAGQVRVDIGLNMAQGAGDKVDDAGDALLARAPVHEEQLDAQVGVADAHEEDLRLLLARLNVVVP